MLSSRWPIDRATRVRRRVIGLSADGSGPQTISLARIDRVAKIRRLGDFLRHLADDNRNMRLGKCIGLDDHDRSRFAVVARRRHHNDVTALDRRLVRRPRRTRKPIRSNSMRLLAVSHESIDLGGEPTSGANRERPDAVRASPRGAVVHASSSFVRQARASRSSLANRSNRPCNALRSSGQRGANGAAVGANPDPVVASRRRR